jgi:hypothetical protein
MPIWFVYRSPYAGPLSKHVKRLDGADTLLDWFRTIWRPIADNKAADAYARTLLGTDVYGFHCLFLDIGEYDLPIPTTIEEFHDDLRGALYIGAEYRGTADTIQIATDDDDYGLAMYWFTDAFAQAHPERVAFLLRDDWRLPETVGPGGFQQKPGVALVRPRQPGSGGLYVVQFDLANCGELDERCPVVKVPGCRLPDLAAWLVGMSQDEAEKLACPPLYCLHSRLGYLFKFDKPEGLELSFRQTLAEDLADTVTWNAYSDWLLERDRPRAELHLLELAARLEAAPDKHSTEPLRLQVAPHSLALMIPRGSDEFEQWYLFDDVWASGNVDLANALLDAAARYNVLDAWDVPSEYSPGIPAGEEREW